MHDLISRKALVAALIKEREQYPPMVAERYSFGVKLPHRFNQAMRGGIRKALRLVETAPAIDAKPEQHGRWKDDTWMWWCDHCDKWFDVAQGGENMNYCPNCGTKMDEEG